MNDLLTAALQYAEWGWPVFPLQDRRKGPRSKHELHTPDGDGGFKVATTDREQIRAWWQRWPRANIGIRTGHNSNIFAIDIDMKDGKDGETVWRGVCSQHAIPDTVEVLTPTGGRHLYFTMPDAALSIDSEGQLGEGVEYRGEGGYVVAPPSIVSQGTYQWELSSDPHDTTLLAALPHSLIDLLVQKRTTEQAEQRGFDGWLAAIGDHEDGEGFHKAVVRAAASYVGRYTRALTDRDYLIWRITQRVQEASWKGDRQALDRRIKTEIPRAVDSALAKYGQAPEIAKNAGDVYEMTGEELMAKQFKPIEWLAENLLHEGMVLFGGKSKRGKSWIMLNLMASIASGGVAFGHYKIPQAQPVLYCALEDGPRRSHFRMKNIDILGEIDHRRIMWNFRMPPLESGGIEYIAKHILDGRKLIVVDVLAHVETSGKNGLRDYHEVYKTFAPLQELRSQHSFALVMVTHLRKAESEEVFDNLHGSVAYQGAQDALWVLERKSGDETANLHIRDKDAEDKVVELKFDGNGLWTFVGEGEEHQAGKVNNEIVQFLREEHKPCSVKEIMIGIGQPNAAYEGMRKRLQRMANLGVIIRTDRGKYTALQDWSSMDEGRF